MLRKTVVRNQTESISTYQHDQCYMVQTSSRTLKRYTQVSDTVAQPNANILTPKVKDHALMSYMMPPQVAFQAQTSSSLSGLDYEFGRAGKPCVAPPSDVLGLLFDSWSGLE